MYDPNPEVRPSNAIRVPLAVQFFLSPEDSIVVRQVTLVLAQHLIHRAVNVQPHDDRNGMLVLVHDRKIEGGKIEHIEQAHTLSRRFPYEQEVVGDSQSVRSANSAEEVRAWSYVLDQLESVGLEMGHNGNAALGSLIGVVSIIGVNHPVEMKFHSKLDPKKVLDIEGVLVSVWMADGSHMVATFVPGSDGEYELQTLISTGECFAGAVIIPDHKFPPFPGIDKKALSHFSGTALL